ncbi:MULTISPECIES: deoxyribodipyrimidine photo-lyase [unclassified Ruegeria]|uniref:cryptochrome/photolyase family protein n=1 Tax=unclassified Ruegeria TaxID=2625375 RepID=UPI00148787B9|nr:MULTISPECIES: deoxyribodipyrimidine photo-lyase [unclassified Ruegeria]NOD63531.1 deoxyribodipyrimidine photo-lyase [Ruegeria sp. HKCCD6109]
MKDEHTPIIMWFRRDLRLSDHPALTAAAESGRPVVPVFLHDDLVEQLGAAPKWRLGLGLEAFSRSLDGLGSRLILRRGDALAQLQALIQETGAGAVYWSRSYDPASIARDKKIKSVLTEQGVMAKSFAGHLLFEPWTVATKTGQPFRVYTPMWRAVQGRGVPAPNASVTGLLAPAKWPSTEELHKWQLDRAMNRGASIVRPYVHPGEQAAHEHLNVFLDRVALYSKYRDRLDMDGTSNLSEYLSLGEISPRTVWHRVQQAALMGVSGTDAFLRQLVWREFAYHLMYHTPQLVTGNWKPEWDSFPWNTDPNHPEVVAWTQARTGVPVVDAGLRQMYVTGRMHNRTRMIVASYLTKHLMTNWKIGMQWFDDCLIDWDPACNAMGWQWVAGSGPDAAPFFRIFNPQTQAEKFDPDGTYLKRWIAEGEKSPSDTAISYFEAVPKSWGLRPDADYPAPIVALAEGRTRALSAYESRKSH